MPYSDIQGMIDHLNERPEGRVPCAHCGGDIERESWCVFRRVYPAGDTEPVVIVLHSRCDRPWKAAQQVPA